MQKNKVYLEDVFDFLSKLEPNSIDLAIIDPPYNQNIDKWDTFKSQEKYFEFTYKWLDIAVEKLKDTGSMYLFNNPYNSAFITTYLVNKGLKFKNWIIWYKKDGFSPSKSKFVNNQEVILFFTKSDEYTFNSEEIRTPYISESRIAAAAKKGILKNGKRWFPNEKGKLCTDVWEFPSVRLTEKVNGKTVKTIHPTPKPEQLIERMVLASSNKNDLVLDLFSGSGTTAFVSKKLNRDFVGCENNELYHNYIIERLA